MSDRLIVPAGMSRRHFLGHMATTALAVPAIQFAAGLIPGHSYRLQVVLHDGDQTKGADSGEGCATFCASAGTACQPASGACKGDGDCCSGLTCSNGSCAPGGVH